MYAPHEPMLRLRTSTTENNHVDCRDRHGEVKLCLNQCLFFFSRLRISVNLVLHDSRV